MVSIVGWKALSRALIKVMFAIAVSVRGGTNACDADTFDTNVELDNGETLR